MKKQAMHGKAAHSLLSLKIRKLNGEFEGKADEARMEYGKIKRNLRKREIDLVNKAEEIIKEIRADYLHESETFEIYSEFAVNVRPILDLHTKNADVVIVTDDIIHVLDLKTGTTEVDEDSDMMKLYGLGAFMELSTGSTATIKLSVIQDFEIKTKTFTVEELIYPLMAEGRDAKPFEDKIARFIQEAAFNSSAKVVLNKEGVSDEIIEGANQLREVANTIFKKAESMANRGYEFKEYGITPGTIRRTVKDMVGAITWLSDKGFTNDEINGTGLNITSLEELLNEEQFEEFSEYYVEEVQSKDSFKRKRKRL